MSFHENDFVTDTSSAVLPGKEFAAIIAHVSANESIKNYRPGSIFNHLTRDQKNDHFIFFIPAGYTRSPQNYKYEILHPNPKNKVNDPVSSAVASVILSSIVGGVILVNIKNNMPSA